MTKPYGPDQKYVFDKLCKSLPTIQAEWATCSSNIERRSLINSIIPPDCGYKMLINPKDAAAKVSQFVKNRRGVTHEETCMGRTLTQLEAENVNVDKGLQRGDILKDEATRLYYMRTSMTKDFQVTEKGVRGRAQQHLHRCRGL